MVRTTSLILFAIAKYIMLYTFLAFLYDNYTVFQISRLETIEDYIAVFLLFGFVPSMLIPAYILLMRYTLRSKNGNGLIIKLVGISLIEGVVYNALSSPGDFTPGLFLFFQNVVFIFFFWDNLRSSKP